MGPDFGNYIAKQMANIIVMAVIVGVGVGMGLGALMVWWYN